MKHFLRLTDIDLPTMKQIFATADTMPSKNPVLQRKSVVLFFPNSSIRTRVTFEKGISLLGGQSILFPPETLDKKEDIKDVVGYLNIWVDGAVIRHSSLALIQEIAKYSTFPVINAMTSMNHPCEVLSDLYALSKRRPEFLDLNYTFIGMNGNIGNTWFEASQVFGFRFRQCCPPDKGFEIAGARIIHDLDEALRGSDIILTDPCPAEALADFLPYQVTTQQMKKANEGALLNPCPPFYRGEEVSSDVIDSPFFVGYRFKESLLAVQQALIVYLMEQ